MDNGRRRACCARLLNILKCKEFQSCSDLEQPASGPFAKAMQINGQENRMPPRHKIKKAQPKQNGKKGHGRKIPLHFELKIAADVRAISPVVERIMKLVTALEYAQGKEFEIEMALREALANAVVHGAKADASKQVECCVKGDNDSGIHIVVRDPGEGFDPAQVASPTDEQNLFSDHGRGIFLINRLMDEVRYERNGAEIHMRKYGRP